LLMMSQMIFLFLFNLRYRYILVPMISLRRGRGDVLGHDRAPNGPPLGLLGEPSRPKQRQ
jgi:hypothetical protein